MILVQGLTITEAMLEAAARVLSDRLAIPEDFAASTLRHDLEGLAHTPPPGPSPSAWTRHRPADGRHLGFRFDPDGSVWVAEGPRDDEVIPRVIHPPAASAGPHRTRRSGPTDRRRPGR